MLTLSRISMEDQAKAAYKPEKKVDDFVEIFCAATLELVLFHKMLTGPPQKILYFSKISRSKMNFINQRNEKELVKISNVAKFQSCRPNTRGIVDI